MSSTVSGKPVKLLLRLLEKRQHSGTDVTSFKFSRTGSDGQRLEFKAGQYCIVDLGTKQDPEGPVRSFTVASSPTENDWMLVTTRIRGTPFKKKLESLEIGSVVSVSAPHGRFVIHEDASKPAVFLSGGIGVTPFRSMIKYATDAMIPLKITMFDANRNQDNIIFKEEFDGWLKSNQNLRVVYALSSASPGWTGETGYINKEMVGKYLDPGHAENAIFYICGPPPMLAAMKKLLVDDLHVPNERMKVEEFLGY